MISKIMEQTKLSALTLTRNISLKIGLNSIRTSERYAEC
jgi:hypothetical protein